LIPHVKHASSLLSHQLQGRRGTAVLPGRSFLKLHGGLGNRIQQSSVKRTRLAPLQIEPPHAGSWQIVSALQTPALAASG